MIIATFLFAAIFLGSALLGLAAEGLEYRNALNDTNLWRR
jgi:hypothetical protein